MNKPNTIRDQEDRYMKKSIIYPNEESNHLLYKPKASLSVNGFELINQLT